MFSLAFTTLLRNHRRTIICIIGLTLISSSILILGGTTQTSNSIPFPTEGGLLTVGKTSYSQNPSQNAYFSEDVPEQLLAHHEIDHAYPILATTTIFQQREITILGVTSDFLRNERKTDALQQGNIETFTKEPSLIMGDGIASTAKVSLGDRIMLQSQPFRVIAVLNHLNTDDDNITYAFLPNLQHALGQGNTINRITIHINNQAQKNTVQSIISQEYPDLSIEKNTAHPAITQHLTRSEIVTLAITAILLGSIVYALILYSTINRQRKELVTMSALGFKKFSIVQILIIETFTMGTVGIFLGYCISQYFSIFGFSYIQPWIGKGIVFVVSPLVSGVTIIAIIIAALMSSAHLAWRISQMNISNALRQIH